MDLHLEVLMMKKYNEKNCDIHDIIMSRMSLFQETYSRGYNIIINNKLFLIIIYQIMVLYNNQKHFIIQDRIIDVVKIIKKDMDCFILYKVIL